jgi:predicted ATPase/DNA-binding CsgD family transcriptional regulator
MTLPRTALVSPVLVGRESELRLLDELLERARVGQGQIVTISGEAGIGKSRLVGHVEELARASSMLLMKSQCFEGDRRVPYAAVAEIVLDVAARPGLGPETWPPGVAAALAPAVPELREALHHEVSVTSLEQDARRIRRALLTLLANLAESRGVVLVCEDVHWIDEASAHLLGRLARASADLPLLLVLTYRGQTHRGSTSAVLADLVGALRHDRLSFELELTPLSRDEVGAMLRACLGRAALPPSEFTVRIHELTDGNPYFLEEVLRALAMTGELCADSTDVWPSSRALQIPRSARDAVGRRLEQLSPLARRTAELAAVLGRRFEPLALQSLVGATDTEVVASLKELVGAGLVVQDADDWLAFRHALTRQAIYAGLLGPERQMLHRRAAEFLEQREARPGDQSRLADLVTHWSAAHVPAKAMDCALRAGELSLSLSAPRSAVGHLSTALAAAEALEDPSIANLYSLRAEAHDLLGDFHAARDDFEASLGLARARRDRQAEWQLVLRLALLWSGRDFEQTRAYAEAALEQARALGDEPLAHTLNRLGNWHLNVGDFDQALRHHERALQLFEQRGDRRGMAQTLELLGMTSNLFDPASSVRHYDRAIPLLEELNERQSLVAAFAVRMLQNGSYWHVTLVPASVPDTDALRNGETALKLARECAWRAGEAFVRWELAAWLGPRGHYQRALDAARQALAIAEEIDHPAWQAGAHLALGAIHLDLLAFDAAVDHLRRAVALSIESDQAIFGAFGSGLLASALIGSGQAKSAKDVLDAAGSKTASMRSMSSRILWVAQAEYALANGEPDHALEIAQRLVQSASDSAGAEKVVPALEKLRGEALHALGRRAEALAVLSTARDAAQHRNLRGLVWRLDLQLGRLQRSLGHRLEADASFEEARSVIQELADGLTEGVPRDNFLRATAAGLPRRRAPTHLQFDKARFGGLTARERDVASLVAAGRSNRQIADALFLSERTVETYMTGILTKLGFESRAQLAAWAVQAGLA